jgi:hypothetical protein
VEQDNTQLNELLQEASWSQEAIDAELYKASHGLHENFLEQVQRQVRTKVENLKAKPLA